MDTQSYVYKDTIQISEIKQQKYSQHLSILHRSKKGFGDTQNREQDNTCFNINRQKIPTYIEGYFGIHFDVYK